MPVEISGAAAPVKGKGLKTLVLLETNGAAAPAVGNGLKMLPVPVVRVGVGVLAAAAAPPAPLLPADTKGAGALPEFAVLVEVLVEMSTDTLPEFTVLVEMSNKTSVFNPFADPVVITVSGLTTIVVARA